MKKGWFSEEAIALVREMAFAKCKNSEIAAAASIRFHTLVTDGMVAGRIGRMGDVPPRNNKGFRQDKMDYFSWVAGEKPEWGTPEGDAVVKAARDRGMTTYRIGKWFEVSFNSVTGAYNRIDDKSRPRPVTQEERTLLSFVTSEWTADMLTTLERMWDLGFVSEQIADKIGVSYYSIRGKIKRLQVFGLLPKHDSGNRQIGPKVTPIAVVRPAQVFPTSSDGRHYSVLKDRAIGLASIGKQVICAWSGCKSPASSHWCDWHTDLLKRPAGEIAAALSCQ